MKINIEDVVALQNQRNAWNRVDLSNIEFYHEGKLITVSKEELDEWAFTGLMNTDYMSMKNWKTNESVFQPRFGGY